MKQILQNMGTGETQLADVPAPRARAGCLLIQTQASLVSVGTEKMLVDFGKANLIDKARQQPEKVKQVLQKVKTDGLATTVHAVRSKLDQPLALGYSNAGVVIEVGDGVDGVLRSFRVREGRVGDFITDKNGHRVGLTALIHGRHHAAFSLVQSVQVAQAAEGSAILHVVAKDGSKSDAAEILAGFDLSGVDVDFELNIRDEPYRTKLGKLPLLIP